MKNAGLPTLPAPDSPLTLASLDSPEVGPAGAALPSASHRGLGRVADVVVSLLALLLLAPLFPWIALGIVASSPGPVLYSQVRVGRDRRRSGRSRPPGGVERRHRAGYGREFRILKFRTMAIDAERDGPRFSRPGDPRIFPFGRFLRRTRLDELPQFWNVLRGDMSLIGPRPERACYVAEYARRIPRYRERHAVRPGLTGLAQVLVGYGDDEAGARRKLALDLASIRRRGLRHDVEVLLRTVVVVVSGRGAR